MKLRLRRYRESRSAALAICLVSLGASLSRGDGRQELATQKVHLELRPLMTGARSATFPGPGRAGDLAVGESEEWSLLIGLDRAGRGGAAECNFDVLIPAFPQRPLPDWAVHAWEARLTVRAASLERIDLEVDWKRLVPGTGAEPVAVAADSRVMTLGEGQHAMLDFVSMRAIPRWESCYASTALELEASVSEDEDPTLASQRIGYDLWLVDEGPGGPSTTRRWQMAGKQGQARDFEFEPLHQSIRDSVAGETLRVDTRVFGQVRGRLQDDGSLEVALVAQREDSPEHRHWSIGGHGDKVVRVAAGETIRLELPAPNATPESGRSEPERHTDLAVLAGLRARTVSLVLTARPSK